MRQAKLASLASIPPSLSSQHLFSRMLCLLAVLMVCLPSIQGLCFTPRLHGFTPDIFLHGLSSDIYCPQPLAFDRYLCMCVDPALVTVQHVTLLDPLELTRRTPFHLHEVVGLPDMHKPGHWRPPNGPAVGGPVVAPLSPFPSFNLPATPDILKAAAKAKMMRATLPSKQQELLDKMRWQQQLQQRSAVMVTATSTPVAGAGGVALDDFVREAMRRVLYGY